jgi:hypothetical protein
MKSFKSVLSRIPPVQGMKLFSVLAVILALAGCGLFSTPKTSTGIPSTASISGVKGIYLKGTAAKVARSVTGRDVVTGTSATLGAISSAGVPESVTFLDSEGLTVTATVSKAVQLTEDYILFTWASPLSSGTSTLNISTGVIASVSVIPDNWANIFARGENAWYVAGGSIYKMDMATGVASVLSTGSATWDTSTNLRSGTFIWAENTWLYADSVGNIYAIYASNSQMMQAIIITASSTIDFGNQSSAYRFFLALPGASIAWSSWIASSSDGYSLYLLQNEEVIPGSGVNYFSAYPITLNPQGTTVISFATTPVSSFIGLAATHIGFGIFCDSSIWSSGTSTFKVDSSGALTRYDTAAVPVSHILDGENFGAAAVTNWTYSGGAIFAGPDDGTFSGVAMATFDNDGTVTDPELVPEGVLSWSVVGGVLFYTTASGTFEAPVNTTAGTLGASTAFSGQVVAVTQ